MQHDHATQSKHQSEGHYGRLLIMIVVSLIAMYVLMYAMVNNRDNALANWNQFYMAGLMTAAMVLIELALMSGKYHDKRLNGVIIGAGAVALIVFWMFIRGQTAIGDKQFLKSMIPHHAAAILMCEKASIRDPEVTKLCEGIVARQQAEIDQMNAKLRELSK
jgi:uncharacterized membrane protein YhaH (DUF805 family)